jgi:hypothetical protein
MIPLIMFYCFFIVCENTTRAKKYLVYLHSDLTNVNVFNSAILAQKNWHFSSVYTAIIICFCL